MSQLKKSLTFHNVITDDRRRVEVSEGQTVREAVIASQFIPPDAGFSVRNKYGEVVDGDLATEHVDEVLHVGPQGNVQGGGSLEHLVLSVSEVLGSGVAGNMAYDLLKNAISHYRTRRDRHRGSTISESDEAATKLLSKDEAIDIAVGLASIATGWLSRPVTPIDAYISNGTWQVRVKAPDEVITVYIPPGDPNSAPIHFSLED